jgi:hypothetical protein
MPVEERRRHELRAHVAGTWGEEAATTLFELLPPAGDDAVTRTYLDGRFGDVDQRFAAIEQRFDRLEAQIEASEHRLTALLERRISDAVATQTRTLVFSQLGALVVIAALAFGLR